MRQKKCHAIKEHFLDEWISIGEQLMHEDADGGKDGGKLPRYLMVGEILEQAHIACHIAKEVAEKDAGHHEPAMHKARPYETPATMKPTV